MNEIKFRVCQLFSIPDEPEDAESCPFCGSKNIEMPNDLCEWICDSCKRWYTIG